jgi:hypothetical protein
VTHECSNPSDGAIASVCDVAAWMSRRRTQNQTARMNGHAVRRPSHRRMFGQVLITAEPPPPSHPSNAPRGTNRGWRSSTQRSRCTRATCLERETRCARRRNQESHSGPCPHAHVCSLRCGARRTEVDFPLGGIISRRSRLRSSICAQYRLMIHD